MTADERFDALLKEHAESYNRPDAVPREAMWEQIRAAREARRVLPLLSRRRQTLQSLAAAAALLLLGIGIGRLTVQSTPEPRRAAVPTPPTGGDAVMAPTPYRMAAAEHFGRAEVLLTQFRSTAEDDPDAEFRAWARRLLVDTRLLMGSPAGSDAEYRELLADLELVLAQIVHAATRRTQDERRWVAESLDQRGVLQRLRLLTPADAGT